jgi:mannitol-1-phosphate 5-dehydrogenase
MRVVVVGPGKIGSGYLAPIFREAGWDVTLAARSAEVADRIGACPSYGVRITALGEHAARSFAVEDVAGVVTGSSAFTRAVGAADLVCVSVGVGRVASVGEPLAAALADRGGDDPVDVWVVENAACAPDLERAVTDAGARAGLRLPPFGCAGAVATVAVARGDWRTPDRPCFVGDAARRLWVDGRPLLRDGPLPEEVATTPAYAARLEEKLYVFNAAHAICAYLGWLRGHETIADAVEDSMLRPMVVGCLLESRRAVLAAHPELGDDLHGPVAEYLRRFGDRELADPIVRVAREPIRKLGPDDRLLGPAHLIRRATGAIPAYFALGIAGALLHGNEDDAQVRELRAELAERGVMAVLRTRCGLAEDDPFAEAIAARYRGFIFTGEETIFPPAHMGSAAAPLDLQAPGIP